MSTSHLIEEELDLLLAGEELSSERMAHVLDCAACRARRENVLRAVAGAGAVIAPPETADRVLAAALGRWRPAGPAWWWSLPAAAVLVLAVGLGVWSRPAPEPALDSVAILAEVDALLAQDPVALVVSEALLDLLTEEPPANST